MKTAFEWLKLADGYEGHASSLSGPRPPTAEQKEGLLFLAEYCRQEAANLDKQMGIA